MLHGVGDVGNVVRREGVREARRGEARGGRG